MYMVTSCGGNGNVGNNTNSKSGSNRDAILAVLRDSCCYIVSGSNNNSEDLGIMLDPSRDMDKVKCNLLHRIIPPSRR